MTCYLKATLEVTLDEDNEELSEDAELRDEYIQNWAYLPQVIQQELQKALSGKLKCSLTVQELKANS